MEGVGKIEQGLKAPEDYAEGSLNRYEDQPLPAPCLQRYQ